MRKCGVAREALRIPLRTDAGCGWGAGVWCGRAGLTQHRLEALSNEDAVAQRELAVRASTSVPLSEVTVVVKECFGLQVRP